MSSHLPDDSDVMIDDAPEALAEFASEARRQAPYSRPVPAPPVFPLEESDSMVVIAILLAIVAIGYGGFLTSVRWREPLETRGTPAQTHAMLLSAATVEPPVAVEHAVLPGLAVDREPVLTHRNTGAFTARTLTAMWTQRDTRSLEHAFSSLRSQTLALHRCGMRMTADDRAVARCEGASRSTYTIDFRRSAGHWLIAGVNTR